MRELSKCGAALLAHVARMAERIAAGLGPDAEAVRFATDRNAVRQLTGVRVEDVHFAIVATTYPQLVAVRGHIPHVGAPAAGNRPLSDHRAALRIEHAHRSRAVRAGPECVPAAIRDIQETSVATRIESVRSFSSRYEADFDELFRVDHANTIGLHVRNEEHV